MTKGTDDELRDFFVNSKTLYFLFNSRYKIHKVSGYQVSTLEH